MASQNVVWWVCQTLKKVEHLRILLKVGHVPLAFITTTHAEPSPTIVKDLNDLVRKQIGGIATMKGVVVLDRIPKTRSGKTLRRVLREIVEKGMDGDWDGTLAVPATVEDRSHVDWAREKVKAWMASQKTKAKL
jgi:propionyl-CoA synthetase